MNFKWLIMIINELHSHLIQFFSSLIQYFYCFTSLMLFRWQEGLKADKEIFCSNVFAIYLWVPGPEIVQLAWPYGQYWL